MTYRTRHILPPRWAIAAYAFIYVLFEAAHRPLIAADMSHDPQIYRPRLFLVLAGALLYGAYRAVAFHPAHRREYADWLRTTPWTARLPLPLGPIHLVWQDILVAAVFSAMAVRIDPFLWSAPIIALLVIYLLLLAIPLQRYGWIVLFALGLAALVSDPFWSLVVCLATYVLTYAGTRHLLKAFPWPEKTWLRNATQVNLASVPSDPDEMKNRLGWPYNRLQPFRIEPAVTTENALAISTLIAWYLYVASTLSGPEIPDVVILVYIVSLVALPIARTITYLSGVRSPLSLAGRLFTGRFIIPGFDRVFVAPIAGCITGLILPLVLYRIGIGYAVSLPMAVGATTWVTLTWGPTLAGWRLTGSHRLVPGPGTGNQFIRI